MTKFNRHVSSGVQPQAAPLTTGITLGPGGRPQRTAATVNPQGGEGYTRDPKSDLFLMAVTSHDITADTFYETGVARIDRFRELARTCAVTDPAWTGEFLAWLRGPGNMRTAAIVGAIEAARAMVQAGIGGSRRIVASVIQRADEPGEAIAYHLAVHGRKLPKPIKRGIADAAVRLYNERALLKYDTATHAVRFGDVLDLTHPAPAADRPWQADLFQHALDRRHGRDNPTPGSLVTVRTNTALREQWTAPGWWNIDGEWADNLSPLLSAAGMTWEDVMSAAGKDADKGKLWSALIPTMGFMARLRNLRNFDTHGVPDGAVADVLAMLTDPDRIAKSRQLPMRFLSAYRATSNLRWAYALERALDLSISNIPALPGNTLILIDTSGSMQERLSERSDLRRWDAAVVFGLALARRCESAAVVSYSAPGWGGYGVFDRSARVSNGWVQFPQQAGESLLHAVGRWKEGGYFIGGGTDTIGTLRATFRAGIHDRAVILTDEQDGGYNTGNPGAVLPDDIPLYTFNLAGYRHGNTPTVNRKRVTIGGLTDHMFGLIPMIEQVGAASWPWQKDAALRQAIANATAAPAGAVTRPQVPDAPDGTSWRDVNRHRQFTVPEGSQGGRWTAADGEWSGHTTGGR